MASCGKWSSSMDNFENVSSVSFGKGKLESRGRCVKICVVKELVKPNLMLKVVYF